MLHGTVKQLSVGDHRNSSLSRPEPAEATEYFLRPSLTDVNEYIRVQQVPEFYIVHYSPFRFCGRSFSRSAGSRALGMEAISSKARARLFSFSRRTSSLPRRKISTSLLFKRNCFGKRTAWLLPERNTRAVGIFGS